MSEEPTIGELFRLVSDMRSRLDKVFDDQEMRLRKLERWQYAVPPTVLIAGASVIVAMVKG